MSGRLLSLESRSSVPRMIERDYHRRDLRGTVTGALQKKGTG
jgi:hypothetical protein